MANANSGLFRAPRARLAFSNSLFESRAFEGGKPKYGATFIFDVKDAKVLVDKLEATGIAQWGREKYLSMRGPATSLPLLTPSARLKWPILDGNGPQARSKDSGELHNGFGPGKVFIRANTADDKIPPEMRVKDKYTSATQAEMYSGCYVLPVINVYAWSHPASGNGLSFGLAVIQKVAEGESIGGRAPVNVDQWFLPDAYEDDEGGDAGRIGTSSIYD